MDFVSRIGPAKEWGITSSRGGGCQVAGYKPITLFCNLLSVLCVSAEQLRDGRLVAIEGELVSGALGHSWQSSRASSGKFHGVAEDLELVVSLKAQWPAERRASRNKACLLSVASWCLPFSVLRTEFSTVVIYLHFNIRPEKLNHLPQIAQLLSRNLSPSSHLSSTHLLEYQLWTEVVELSSGVYVCACTCLSVCAYTHTHTLNFSIILVETDFKKVL